MPVGRDRTAGVCAAGRSFFVEGGGGAGVSSPGRSVVPGQLRPPPRQGLPTRVGRPRLTVDEGKPSPSGLLP